MRNLLVIFFVLFACVASFGQTFHSNAQAPSAEPLHIDTTAPIDIDKLLNLPSALTLVSCEVVFSGKHEIFKETYVPGASSEQRKRIWEFMKRAKKGEAFYLDEIYVMKEGKRLKLADKYFKIQ